MNCKRVFLLLKQHSVGLEIIQGKYERIKCRIWNLILLYLILFILFYFILFYLFYLFYLFIYFILFYFILFYFILFYFILFYFILFYFHGYLDLDLFIIDTHNLIFLLINWNSFLCLDIGLFIYFLIYVLYVWPGGVYLFIHLFSFMCIHLCASLTHLLIYHMYTLGLIYLFIYWYWYVDIELLFCIIFIAVQVFFIYLIFLSFPDPISHSLFQLFLAFIGQTHR